MKCILILYIIAIINIIQISIQFPQLFLKINIRPLEQRLINFISRAGLNFARSRAHTARAGTRFRKRGAKRADRGAVLFDITARRVA